MSKAQLVTYAKAIKLRSITDDQGNYNLMLKKLLRGLFMNCKLPFEMHSNSNAKFFN